MQSCVESDTKDQKESNASTEVTTEKNGDYYEEAHRPQFHFSPEANWMNDPNGMFFYEGEYHLFYQYYPDSTVWGPMHWAHAVSADLVNWEHLPIGLYPDDLGYIFSGSAVVDWNNTSGFGKGEEPPLIAIFTHHEPAGEKDPNNIQFQYQSIAYSNDKGRTWTKYEGNPVIPNPGIKDFRDPKVIWDGEREQWLMVFAAYDHSKFYASKDLKKWEHLSDWGKNYGTHGGIWECPDIFPMSVEGTEETKWVLLQSINPGSPNGGSGTQYFVGDFDGKNFILDKKFEKDVLDEKAVWLDYGRDNYAGVTWSDVPESDGRRLFMGWMSNWDYAQVVPTDTWRSAMTLPRKLTLKNTSKGYRVFSEPVVELKKLQTGSVKLAATDFAEKMDLTGDFNAAQSEMVLEFDLEKTDADRFGVELSNSKGELFRVGFDKKTNQFFSDRTKAGKHDFSKKFAVKEHLAPRLGEGSKIKLHLFFDAASVELFADNGATAITDVFFPNEDFSSAKLFSENGKTSLAKGIIYPLGSIWKK